MHQSNTKKIEYVILFDVYWTVRHLDNAKDKIQIEATYYFIILLLGSTCFEHHYAHHQELTTKALVTT